MSEEAQDEPSAAPPPITGRWAIRTMPDEYPKIVKTAVTRDYLKHLKV